MRTVTLRSEPSERLSRDPGILTRLNQSFLTQGARVRRAALGWIGREHTNCWRFWAVSGDDARALFEEFATIQHYIRGEEETFLQSLQLARSFGGSESGNASRTSLLLDVLEANQLVRNDDIDAAVACYRRRIQQEERTYSAMLRCRHQFDVRRELVDQREVLGLLELNLGELLRRQSADSDQGERNYGRACSYMPDSTYAHRCYAEFFISQKRWEKAIKKFKEAYAERGLDDKSYELNANLAWVYRQWALWLNTPTESASASGAIDAVVSSQRARRFINFRRFWSRLAGTAAPPRVLSLPAPLHITDPRTPSAALQRLDEALRTLKWKDTPSWEGAIRFDRASILESEMNPDRAKEISSAFLVSAQRFSDARDAASSASAFARAGDVLTKRGELKEAIAAYENGLKQAEAVEAEADWQKQQKRNTVDTLLSSLAITRLGLGDRRGAIPRFARLREQWWPDGDENARRGGQDWGPYYDVQSLAKPILARSDLRYSLTIYYHRLLAEAPHLKAARDLKDARDITAALLDLYAFERQETKGRAEDTDVLGGALGSDTALNVVTPLAIEMSENLTALLEREDKAVRTSPTFVFDDFKDLPSLADKLKHPKRPIDSYFVNQLSASVRASLDAYESFVSAPEPLQVALLEKLEQIVRGPCIYDAQRFKGIELRTETNRLLSEVPKNDDVRYLNVLLLEDAYSQELSRSAVGRYAGAVRRRIEAVFGVRVPGLRVRESADLKGNSYHFLIHELVVAEGTCKNERLDQIFLHLETAIAAHLVEFVGHQETQNYLERHRLVVSTVEDISEKEHCSHIDPLTAVLRTLVTERVPLTEPKAIYEVFRSGWKQGIAIAAIVERVRRIPKVQANLWGNDGKHTYVLLPSSVENVIGVATLTAGQSDYLVMKERERARILAAIGKTIDSLAHPALIARRQEQRALLRQLISTRYPEVPVLSASELRSSADQVLEMPEIDC